LAGHVGALVIGPGSVRRRGNILAGPLFHD
jgi:hypothetical protein